MKKENFAVLRQCLAHNTYSVNRYRMQEQRKEGTEAGREGRLELLPPSSSQLYASTDTDELFWEGAVQRTPAVKGSELLGFTLTVSHHFPMNTNGKRSQLKKS